MMLAATLRTVRSRHNLTQAETAAALGVTTSAVAMWETGKREPDYATLLKIAELFSVSVDYLLGNPEQPSPDEQLTGVDFALWGEVRDLTDAQKRDILEYVRFKKRHSDSTEES